MRLPHEFFTVDPANKTNQKAHTRGNQPNMTEAKIKNIEKVPFRLERPSRPHKSDIQRKRQMQPESSEQPELMYLGVAPTQRLSRFGRRQD